MSNAIGVIEEGETNVGELATPSTTPRTSFSSITSSPRTSFSSITSSPRTSFSSNNSRFSSSSGSVTSVSPSLPSARRASSSTVENPKVSEKFIAECNTLRQELENAKTQLRYKNDNIMTLESKLSTIEHVELAERDITIKELRQLLESCKTILANKVATQNERDTMVASISEAFQTLGRVGKLGVLGELGPYGGTPAAKGFFASLGSALSFFKKGGRRTIKRRRGKGVKRSRKNRRI
jgi:hypothetical protein